MILDAGTKLGRYEIRSKLGEGGMGEVCLATDTKLQRRVALKILPTEVAADRNRMNRFVQEAKAASALNHPNILTIYEIDESDSLNFIASEFVDGETLRQRMKTVRPSASDVEKFRIVLNRTAKLCLSLVGRQAVSIIYSVLDIETEGSWNSLSYVSITYCMTQARRLR
jgi:serine/threonine protein kinase